jgi:hypothetical protein
MKTVIEGVEITPQISEILKKWFIFNPRIDESYPEYYALQLGVIQDYLCRKLDEYDAELEEIRQMLIIIVSMKDDFKQLIPENNLTEIIKTV